MKLLGNLVLVFHVINSFFSIYFHFLRRRIPVAMASSMQVVKDKDVQTSSSVCTRKPRVFDPDSSKNEERGLVPVGKENSNLRNAVRARNGGKRPVRDDSEDRDKNTKRKAKRVNGDEGRRAK